MTEDATEKTMDTVMVRIAVVVNSKGEWYAYGRPFTNPRDEQEVMDMAIDGMGEKVGAETQYWLTSYLTIPTVQEVHADKVERADGE